MRAALLFSLLSADPADIDTEPPLLASGMELLYSDRVAFAPSGEPTVNIGLTTGQERISFASADPMQVDFYESGVQKRATVQPGSAVLVSVRRAEPAKRRHYLDVGGVAHGRDSKLDWAMASWKARGYDVEAIEEGTVLGIGGRVLDNRELRIVVPARDAAHAQALAQEIYRQSGQRAVVKTRLVERPWGELAVAGGAGPLGRATSYVRFVPLRPDRGQGTITVQQVEYGKGYGWHGREDRTYRGEIYAVIDPDGKLAAVNVLGAEQVLASVVASEIFSSSPPEALRAQAVAARNHLLAMLGRRHHGDPFHLCSEQHCQVYSGITKEDPRTSAAVAATRGEALFHSGQLVHAVYSSTCGGHTEDNDAVWGDEPDPALRGRPDFDVAAHPELAAFAAGIDEAHAKDWVAATPDSYCARARQLRPANLRWQRRFSAAELAELVGAQLPGVGALHDIAVGERGRGGRVISLRLAGERNEALVLYELPIRQMFANLSSGAFVVDLERDAAGAVTAATFRGGGWGHGVGMCQLGAIGRAEAGQRYADILSHYFNGAALVQLYGDAPVALSP